jgi:hypothetical protein
MKWMWIVLVAVTAVFAAEHKPPAGSGENESVDIAATLYADRDSIRGILGSDLDGNYIVLDVRVTPKYEKEVSIERDQFVLRTDKDGEKSTPFTPSQIAGRGVLVVSESGSGGGFMGDRGGPMIGGYPGGGMPGRLGGESPGVGNAAGETTTQSKAHSGSKDKEDPILKVLRQKMLPEKKTDQPIAGLLYFPLGKQKIKHLELLYDGPGGKISMRFK